MKIFTSLILVVLFSLGQVAQVWAQDNTAPQQGEWTIYHANELPTDADPAWNASNGAGTVVSVESDPVRVGNSILAMDNDGSVEGSGMFKTSDFDPVPTALTVVMRIKAKDLAADRLTDIDMHVNGFRDGLNIRSNGSLTLQRSGASVDLSEVINMSEWNVFRVTMDASSGTEGIVKVYLNESPIPVLTATTTTTTGSNYYRFGDGNGSPTYSSYIDYISHDVTGAFSPAQTRLPNEVTKPPVGEWTIYHANELPTDADPAWNASNGAGTVVSVESDPIRVGNNILAMDNDGSVEGSGMFKTSDFDPVPTKLTVVMRIKAKDLAADRLTDIDMHVNGFRDGLNIRSNGSLTLQRSGASVDLSEVINMSDWNVFRVTMDASSGTEGDVKIYLNENPTPVLTATTTTTTGSNYYRFGDGNGSPTYSAYIDYISHDVTGAYSPAQTRLPNEVTKPPVGEWAIYNANELPTDADPAWNASNGAGTVVAVESDPIRVGNNILAMDNDGSVEGSGMFKTNDFDPVPTALTIVLRIKAKDLAADRLTDIDMHVNGFRDGLNIRSNGSLTLQRSGAAVDLSEVMSVSDWNVFRVTMDASSGTEGKVNIYLNENPIPVLTATTTTTTGSNYFRFGDGNGSPTYSSYIDYILWDETGAYSPNQTRLSAELTGDDEGATPTITAPPALASFQQHLNSPSAENSFAVTGANLQGDITITPPAGYEISLTSGAGFAADPIVLAQTDGTVAETMVYIRLNAGEVGEQSGDVVMESTGTSRVLPVEGLTVVPEITVNAALEAFTESVSSASPSQSYSVSAVYLVADLTVTAPANYEVSLDDSNWSTSVTLSPDGEGTLAGTSVYVRLNATALGEYTGNVTHASTDAVDQLLAVSGETIPDPGIVVESGFTAFSQAVGAPSAVQTYTVSGSNLASNVVITVGAPFEVSAVTGASATWSNTLELVPVEGNVRTYTLYVRQNATAEGDFSATITHSSDGVGSEVVNLSGNASGMVLSSQDELASFNVWPNPSTGRLVMSRVDIENPAVVNIYSLAGNRLANYTINSGSKTLDMNVSSLTNGIYVLEYLSAQGKNTIRFVKE